MADAEKYMALGYPQGKVGNSYYTAMLRPGIGLVVSDILKGCFVQLFPWVSPELTGHVQYAGFITSKSTSDAAKDQRLFTNWPYIYSEHNDLLIVKCMVEEALKRMDEAHDADSGIKTFATAGEAVERHPSGIDLALSRIFPYLLHFTTEHRK